MTAAERVLRSGVIVQDGDILCPVRIVETNVRPLYLAAERAHEAEEARRWFRIDLAAAGEPDQWSSSIDGFRSVDEALAHLGSSVIWEP